MNKKYFILLLLPIFLINVNIQITTESEPVQIFGAGSTFSQPLINQWASAYANGTNNLVQISYGGGGSGVGITQITDNTIDFAGSDAPMSLSEQAAAVQNGGSINHIPETMGAIVMS